MAKQKLSSLSVGSTIKLNVSNAPTEFIIIHQGKPSDLYDDSCNGTWLLMKDILDKGQWNSSVSSSYKTSTIHNALNNEILSSFDNLIQDIIKEVKIPYVNGNKGSAVASGANGLSTKIFLLSGYELGWTTSTNSSFPVDGACLSYFNGIASTHSKRIGYLSNSATIWWTRSPGTSTSNAWIVSTTGSADDRGVADSHGIRPALVLPSDYEIDLPMEYDLTSTTPSKIQTGDILNCPYSGSAKSITLPKGTYKLECWGAAGGNANQATTAAYLGANGGYSVGTLTLKKKTTVYLTSGGVGKSSTTSGAFTAGGFNGGGNAGSYRGGSGGGASDIRIGTDSLYARVIVAGGGGGSAYYTNCTGGQGGGESGNTAKSYLSGSVAGSGTQTAGGSAGGGSYILGNAGSFGQGGAGNTTTTNYNRSAGGGGGWYGGGGSGYRNSSSFYYYGLSGGGGGSGYVYTSSTASNYPTGCLLTSDYYLTDAQTIIGNTSFTSPTGTAETGHSGNGYVRITAIDIKSGNTLIKASTILPSSYTQLEYIKCEGAQYINTEFVPTGNTRLILDFQLDRVAGQALFCGGRTAAAGDNAFSYTAFFGNSNASIRRDYYGTSKTTTKTWQAGDRIVFDANKNITTINGDSTLLSDFTLNTSSTSVMPIVLFTTCYQASSSSSITLSNSNWAYYKVYSCKIYDNGTLVRNFIPAKNSSGTIGLYDTVNSKFYTNSGTGTFSTGEETSPWKNYKNMFVKTDSTTWKQAKGLWVKTDSTTWKQAL